MIYPDVVSLETPMFPPAFEIVRVYLNNGSSYEATWTGDVWWLRRGAIVPADQVERWEPVLEPLAL